jgi:glycosyltransferase involved in cell wall biosynthesis
MRTTNMLAQLTMEIKKGAEFPKFYLLHGDMSDNEVASLYRHPKIKALVAPTRGEGFGLPILEAAASGLPVIATGWSAQTEFLGKGKYVKLDYRLEQIHQSRVDNQIWMENAKWANVKEEDFKHRVKKFVESPQMPQQWAKDLAVTLKKEYSYEAVAAQYTEALKEVLG